MSALLVVVLLASPLVLLVVANTLFKKLPLKWKLSLGNLVYFAICFSAGWVSASNSLTFEQKIESALWACLFFIIINAPAILIVYPIVWVMQVLKIENSFMIFLGNGLFFTVVFFFWYIVGKRISHTGRSPEGKH